MGYYINGTPAGYLPAKGKVKFLVQNLGAKPVEKIEFQPNLVCVVDNGAFEAAAYVYSEQEFNEFHSIDKTYTTSRTRHWLIVPNADVLSGFKKEVKNE